jgi:hypothetical protein
MKLWLGGGEKSAHRSMLLAAGVKRVAVNLTHLPVPKKKEFVISSVFPNAEVLLYTSENDEQLDKYDEFVRTHADHLSVVIGRPDYNGDWLGSKYVPIWNDDQDVERLAFLCQKHSRVAVSDKAITPKTMPRIKQLSSRWSTELVGITSKTDFIEQIEWADVVVNSWTSSVRYGETQVFDGHGMRRYPAQSKETARRAHRSDIARLGVDVEAVLSDDAHSLGELAIKSWLAWEANKLAYDPSSVDDEDEFRAPHSEEIATTSEKPHTPHSGDPGRSSIAIARVNKRHESERELLPVMGIETITSLGSQTYTNEGEELEIDPETVPIIRSSSESVRQCNSCYLASKCPGFREDADCAYRMPVEIRTKDQLQAALRSILEMQVGRIMFARFAEELEGQGVDVQLSKEMERFFKMVEQFKDISDTREFVRMEIETRSSSGVLSRLFGSKVGESARELPQHIGTFEIDSVASSILDQDDV